MVTSKRTQSYWTGPPRGALTVGDYVFEDWSGNGMLLSLQDVGRHIYGLEYDAYMDKIIYRGEVGKLKRHQKSK